MTKGTANGTITEQIDVFLLEKWFQIWYHYIGDEMGDSAKDLYNKALCSVHNFSFNELCSLAEGAGYKPSRQNGSHKIYKHTLIPDRYDAMVNIQSIHGKAKPVQVKKLVDLIDKYGLLEGR